MHCIVVPVKFGSGLSIPVLRNKQLFKKNGRQKITFSKVADFLKRRFFKKPMDDHP
jgi:hypothetical protein